MEKKQVLILISLLAIKTIIHRGVGHKQIDGGHIGLFPTSIWGFVYFRQSGVAESNLLPVKDNMAVICQKLGNKIISFSTD